jgi:hypothetical protein
MSRELLSEDAVTRQKWPILFWANRVALVGTGMGFGVWIGFAAYQTASPISEDSQSTANLLAFVAFLLGVLSGLAFIFTGYVRLYMVHRLPDRAARATEARPMRRLVRIIAGTIVVVLAVLAGWIHWNVETAVVFVVVVGGLFLVQRWH